jgi:hypothetical protein
MLASALDAGSAQDRPGSRCVPGRGRRLQDFENPLFQFGQIADHDFPHRLKIDPKALMIDPKVLMGQHIPKAHHVAPQLVRMHPSKLVRAPARLAQDLKMMNNPCPNQLVFLKRAPTAPRIFLNQLDRFEHVGQA